LPSRFDGGPRAAALRPNEFTRISRCYLSVILAWRGTTAIGDGHRPAYADDLGNEKSIVSFML
jgi:hypothetical protein